MSNPAEAPEPPFKGSVVLRLTRKFQTSTQAQDWLSTVTTFLEAEYSDSIIRLDTLMSQPGQEDTPW